MSGFVAIIAHQRGMSIAEDEIATLADAYERLRGPATRRLAQARSYARLIAFEASSTIHPDILRDGASWAAVDGFAHAQSAMVSAPLNTLDGLFGLIRYDAQADDVIVATDPLGMRPIYSATRADRTYISNSALALAAFLHAPPEQLGVLTFLRTGSNFGTLTNWQGVERLEPGSYLRFSASGCERQVYWRPAIDESIRRLSFSQTVDYCIEQLTETYRSYLAPLGPLWSDLTGGHDSRLLDLLLDHAGVEFHTNTTGDPQHIDVRIAREVAATAGWDWTNFTLPND